MLKKSRILAALVAALLACGALTVVSPAPADAAPRVTITGTPEKNKETKLKLHGTGFQSVKNGFGGIYVLFGTKLSGNWRPSQGGKTGQDYRYQYDNEDKPAGYQVFVSFPGSSTQDAANGGTIHADGTWNATIRVAGEKFKSYDRDNNEVDVDCAKTGCGVMTIGAHGVVNPSNESFTKVEFAAGSGGAAGAKDTGAKNKSGATERTGTTGGSGSGSGSGSPGGDTSGGTVVAASSQPLVDSDGVDRITGKMSGLLFGILIAVIAGAILVALAVGIGSYLATQSLLLGVNPEALERVRGRRAKRAVAAAEKQKRRVAKYTAKQELRTRKVQQSGDAHVARAGISADYAAAEAAERQWARAGAAGAGEEAVGVGGAGAVGGSGAAGTQPGPMSFFERIGEAEETRVLATVPASGGAGESGVAHDVVGDSGAGAGTSTEGRH